jgi:hypothetical protein
MNDKKILLAGDKTAFSVRTVLSALTIETKHGVIVAGTLFQ